MPEKSVAKPILAAMTKSQYADRETLGSIAVAAARKNERVEVGDMSREIMKAFVEDLNDTIKSNPFDDRPFYITVHEKKDAQLKNVLVRRLLTSEKRPYPECNTSVFWTHPIKGITKFCWSLPHWSAFPNVLANPQKYGLAQIADINAYCSENMEHFGFFKAALAENKTPLYVEMVGFKDRELKCG